MSKPTVETVMAKCASTMDALLAGEIEPEQAQKTADEAKQVVRSARAELAMRELTERGIRALQGVLDGSVSLEDGAAVADFVATSLRFAKLEIDVQQPAANTSP